MMQFLHMIFGDRQFGATRSTQWPVVEKVHLQKEPLCLVCNSKRGVLNPLNVHHISPFHNHPELELEESNLITLCRKCHFLFGHLNNWASYNSTVKADSEMWNAKIKHRP